MKYKVTLGKLGCRSVVTMDVVADYYAAATSAAVTLAEQKGGEWHVVSCVDERGIDEADAAYAMVR